MYCDTYYKSYKFEILLCYQTDPVGLDILQFYGRQLKISVPKMTSNTEPYGEAKANSNGYAPEQA